MSDWQDKMVGARMAVDDSYSSAVDNSRFSRQEWGLIMTAVEFDIRDPADEERAELVADTSHLPDIVPELEKVANMQGAMGGMGEPDRGGGGGLFDSLKGALGLGGDDGTEVDESKVLAAESLAEGYAAELQAYLEEHGRWTEIRETYRQSRDRAPGDS